MTFNEYCKRRRLEEDVANNPNATPQPMSQAMQDLLPDAIQKMGSKITPPDPKMPMATYLKNNPKISQDLLTTLIKDPKAKKAGLSGVNVNNVQKLLMGDQSPNQASTTPTSQQQY